LTQKIRKYKHRKITLANQGIVSKAGRPVEVGSGKKFKDYLEKYYGINKQDYANNIAEVGTTLSERIQAKVKGLESWQNYIDPIIQYYNMTHARGINIQEDLMILEADLIEYRQIKSVDPTWSPIEDEHYQKGLERKAMLMKAYSKMQLDYSKLKLAAESKGRSDDTIVVGDMIIDDGSVESDK